MNFVEDKNPKDVRGETPLHKAAENGYLDICKIILEDPSVDDKNPKCLKIWDMDYCRDFKGETPLHLAAKDGYLEICQLMIIYIENKSPKRNDGKTPGQLAHKKHCYSSYQDT
jgi:ankyrin repeat protein